MRKRSWVIPFIMLAVISVAWILRWDNTGQEGSRLYYKDRWLGQTWVKDRSEPTLPDHPVIAADIIDQATQAAINADPSLSAEYQRLEQEIARQSAIRNANEPFAQEYARILTNQSNDDVLRLLTGDITNDEFSIPEEIQQGDDLYEQSSYQLTSLNQLKEDLWQSSRAAAERSLYDKATSQRKLAAIIVTLLMVINLIWLVYLLCFYRPQTVSSANRPLATKTSGDEIEL